MTADGDTFLPCRNPGCPHGRPQVRAFVGMGHVFPQLCDGCREEAERAEQAAEMLKAQRAATERLMKGIREPLRSWSMESLEALDDQRELAPARRAAEDWGADILVGNEPRDLYLWGRVGRRKTGLVWAVVRQLAELHGVPCAFVNFREMLEQLRESYDDRDQRPNLRHLRGVRVLVIDDLGAERPTEWAAEQLASLVDYRNGATWTAYTSNYALSELAERFGRDDPIVGQRIVSRIAQGAAKVEVGGRDHRL